MDGSSGETGANAELAWKIFDRIETEVRFAEETGLPMERGWDQTRWITVGLQESECGTTACFAGWTALETGCTPYISEHNRDWFTLKGLPTAHAVEVLTPEGQRCLVSVWAQRQLGLNDDERCELFGSGASTPEQLEAVLRRIFGPRPEEN